MSRTRSSMAAIGAVALLLAMVLQPWAAPTPPQPESAFSGPVVAKVGDVPVYLSEAQSRYETMNSIHGETGILDEEALKARILDSLKFDVVVIEGARQEGVVVSAPELAVYISGPLSAELQTSEDLQSALDQLGVSFPELARRVHMNFLGSRIYQEVGQKDLTLTDKEIRKYYREHSSEYNIAENEDPVVVFNAVKPEIAQTLLKEKQDAAFSEWFANLAKDYEIQIVMEDWWSKIEKTKEPRSSVPDPSAAPTNDAGGAPVSPTPVG